MSSADQNTEVTTKSGGPEPRNAFFSTTGNPTSGDRKALPSSGGPSLVLGLAGVRAPDVAVDSRPLSLELLQKYLKLHSVDPDFKHQISVADYLHDQGLYDSIQEGVVLIGAENHIARDMVIPMFHDILKSASKRREDWDYARQAGVCAVIETPGSAQGDRLIQQRLYTVVGARPIESEQAAVEVIGAVKSALQLRDSDAVLNKLASPETKIVALTLDPHRTKSTNESWDIKAPSGAVQQIVAALYLRFRRDEQPFTVLNFDTEHPSGEKIREEIFSSVASLSNSIEHAELFTAYLEKQLHCPDLAVTYRSEKADSDSTAVELTRFVASETGLFDFIPIRAGTVESFVVDRTQLPEQSLLFKIPTAQNGQHDSSRVPLVFAEGLYDGRQLDCFKVIRVPYNRHVWIDAKCLLLDVDETILLASGEIIHGGPTGRFAAPLQRLLKAAHPGDERFEDITSERWAEFWNRNFRSCTGMADLEVSRLVAQRAEEVLNWKAPSNFLSEYQTSVRQFGIANADEFYNKVQLVDGMPILLREAEQANKPMAICTASPESVIFPVLSRHGVMRLIGHAVYEAGKRVKVELPDGQLVDRYSGAPFIAAFEGMKTVLHSRFQGVLCDDDISCAAVCGDSANDALSAFKAGVKKIIMRIQVDPNEDPYTREKKFLQKLQRAIDEDPELCGRPQDCELYLVHNVGQVTLSKPPDVPGAVPGKPFKSPELLKSRRIPFNEH